MPECAIPEHLRTERTCPMSTPSNYIPPFPSYCARFPTTMTNLVMVVIGAQYSSPAENDGAGIATIKKFVTDTSGAASPKFWEVASVTDKTGAFNIATLAYWPCEELYQQWEEESGFRLWWQGLDPELVQHGWFLEHLNPTVDRLETVFSNNEVPEGASYMRENISGELLEHAYWGSVRDRLPVAQNDSLAGTRWSPRVENASNVGQAGLGDDPGRRRIRVAGKQNLCVIRSGQDWSGTLPDERRLYLETMHPVLVKGMNFLRDSGEEVGCYSMNLWDVVDSDSYERNTERTFGFGYFDDLSSLEDWSKSHQTHINIFGGFLMYAKKLNNVLSLRLFHEILVLEPDQQFFEYVGCHNDTSMLTSLRM